ncbi:hypothetical protein ACN6MT_19435 [Neobacillus niacini]|uniref:hypothetical protein n=1 Tax=Neobacillus niacini TaxID=86668 RepID=UPI003B01864D
MVINIADDVLKEGKTNPQILTALKYLFYFFESGYHSWWLTLNDDEELYNINELSSFREFIIKQIKKESLKGGGLEPPNYYVKILPNKNSIEQTKSEIERQYPNAQLLLLVDGHRLRIEENGRVCEIISIDILESFVGDKLKVVLEDIRSDKLFIMKSLELLEQIQEEDLSKLRLEFINGGGSNIKNQIEHYQCKHRVICIIDSDHVAPGLYLNDKERRKKEKLIRLCNSLGVPLKILSKREIENYLPDQALIAQGVNENHPFFIFNDTQKDYFDMKNGLKKNDLDLSIWQDNAGLDSDEVAASSSEENLILNGFGESIWQAFQYVNSKEELESRDQNNEIQAILKEILHMV